MRYRDLGDLRVSVVGLGCSRFGGDVDRERTREVVAAALDAGITLFDTADVYGGKGEGERVLRAALAGRRDEVLLATKFGMDWTDEHGETAGPPGSAMSVRRAVEGSLRRLGTDRIDLYQYHLPDGVTPIEETLGALDELVREGKVRAIGCSNFTAGQLADAADAARENGLTPFVSAQNQYSLLERGVEVELVPECERRGVAVIPYFPLASGLLTGKYGRDDPAPAGAPPHARGGPQDGETHACLEGLARFASARGLRPVHVAVAGLAARPAVASVIAGATTPEQARENAAAAAWEPAAAELEELDRIFPVPGNEPEPARRPTGVLARVRRRLRR